MALKLVLVAMVALAVSRSAQAYQAYIAAGGSLQAGPAFDYPSVATISDGEPVEVFGCVEGYDWCDVSFHGYRGWFDGRHLLYSYEAQRVPLVDFGQQIGVPVVTFALDDYWGNHYRGQPFFRDRDRWARLSSGAESALARANSGIPMATAHGGQSQPR